MNEHEAKLWNDKRDRAESFYDNFKEMEQAYMVLMDQYMDLACAAGFQREGLFGDTVYTHEAIVKQIKELVDNVWKIDTQIHQF